MTQHTAHICCEPTKPDLTGCCLCEWVTKKMKPGWVCNLGLSGDTRAGLCIRLQGFWVNEEMTSSWCSSFNERSRTGYFPFSARIQIVPTHKHVAPPTPMASGHSLRNQRQLGLYLTHSQSTSLPWSKRANKCLFLRNRGRGKALVEDEDSTDGMETAETGSTQETGNCSLV